jgi:hypothetical protein
MRSRIGVVYIAVAASALLLAESRPARADGVKSELWLAGGFVEPDYPDTDESLFAVLRAGGGAKFLDRLTLGASTQVDRAHYFYFAYAGVILPPIGLVEPYGRFHAGRRDDVSDTALGWTAGVRLGDGNVFLMIEVHGVIEPGSADGASLGVTF